MEQRQMMTKRSFLASGASLAAIAGVAGVFGLSRARSAAPSGSFEVTKTEEEWRAILTPEQYAVLREHDTERAGTSPLLAEHR